MGLDELLVLFYAIFNVLERERRGRREGLGAVCTAHTDRAGRSLMNLSSHRTNKVRFTFAQSMPMAVTLIAHRKHLPRSVPVFSKYSPGDILAGLFG